MADLFAADCILLVGEEECRKGDFADVRLVIQRAVWIGGVVYGVVDCEMDVAQEVGLAA